MNRRQLITLLVLALIACAAGLAVYKQNSSTWQGGTSASGKVLGDFDLNNVARVVITSSASTATLAKKDNIWVVHERDDYPANFTGVGNLIQELWQMKPVQGVEVGASQLGRLELLPPGQEAGQTGTLIDLQDKDSKRIAALMVGKDFFQQSAQMPGDEGEPAGRYVMPAGASLPQVSLVSETLDDADPNPVAWLDTDFLKIDRIQSVALSSGTASWKLTRATDTATDWTLADAKPGEKVDSTKVPSFAGVLGASTFIDVLPANAKRDVSGSTVVITTFDNFTYTLGFGKADGDKMPLTVAVAADLPKARVPGKDEKPDEKKKLDDAFASKSKRLDDTLAKAKGLEARVYLVAKSTFDPIFKSRSDFLVKPAAPSPSPASGAPSVPVTVTTPPISAPGH